MCNTRPHAAALLLELYYDRLLSADWSSLYLTCRERRKWDCQQRDRINLRYIDWQPSTFSTSHLILAESTILSCRVLSKSNLVILVYQDTRGSRLRSLRSVISRGRNHRGSAISASRTGHVRTTYVLWILIFVHAKPLLASRRGQRRFLYFIYSAILSVHVHIGIFWINKETILHHAANLRHTRQRKINTMPHR